jgi:hypothetical protein
MVNYLFGKIYSITCLLTGQTYIGSTAQPVLAKRINCHISNYKNWSNPDHPNKPKYCSSFKAIENDAYAIQVVEEFPCSEKKQLEERELWYINTTENCINKYKPSLLSKKEYQRLYHKQWHQDNKEQQLQYHKERYQKKKQEKISGTIIEQNEVDQA